MKSDEASAAAMGDAGASAAATAPATPLLVDERRFGHPEIRLLGDAFVLWASVALLAAFLLWANWATLDEVSLGTGKITPTSREQIIQSLEGGIVTRLLVKDGDIVEAGQVLAQLDKTRNRASVDEAAAKIRALKASGARLQAEVNNRPLQFPHEVRSVPELVRYETELYASRRESLQETVDNLTTSLNLVESELRLSEPLLERGSVSQVEVLRLRRQTSELRLKIAEAKSQYAVRAREELAKVHSELESQLSVRTGRQDILDRATLTAPMRGIVKDVQVTTVGGVLAPGTKLMELVPLGDRLVVEARISPRDIAFIHPGQRATVKITAYDYAIYGALEGKVDRVSPDTLQDEVHRDQYYYRVYVGLANDHLTNKAGKRFPIVPGMVTTVEIHTGQKTVAQYLLKPLNKASEALRER
ncbi:MAG: HlyD family efflux transporter periplasmic adaptor subunit [Betaproteobacteria bacterium]|nr:HlyD family efflux transporter periplasmic adaptor subunit [Betaproteobacteria bacterium]